MRGTAALPRMRTSCRLHEAEEGGQARTRVVEHGKPGDGHVAPILLGLVAQHALHQRVRQAVQGVVVRQLQGEEACVCVCVWWWCVGRRGGGGRGVCGVVTGQAAGCVRRGAQHAGLPLAAASSLLPGVLLPSCLQLLICLQRLSCMQRLSSDRHPPTRMNWGIWSAVRPPGGELEAHMQVGGLHLLGSHL